MSTMGAAMDTLVRLLLWGTKGVDGQRVVDGGGIDIYGMPIAISGEGKRVCRGGVKFPWGTIGVYGGHSGLWGNKRLWGTHSHART